MLSMCATLIIAVKLAYLIFELILPVHCHSFPKLHMFKFYNKIILK